MVQTNIAGAGVNITPSARVQQQKELSALAQKIGLVTPEERVSRYAAQQTKIQNVGSSPQEQQLKQDISTMNRAEQMAAAGQVDPIDKLSPEEIAGIMMSPAPSVTINEEEAIQNEQLNELRERNKLLTKHTAGSEFFGFPDVYGARPFYDIVKATDGTGKESSALLQALNRHGKVARAMQKNIGLKVTEANRQSLLEQGNSWKVASNAVMDPSGELTYGEVTPATRPLFKRDDTLQMNTTSIILEALNAGALSETGKITVDPELFNIMAINAEQSFIEAMYASDQEPQTPDVLEDLGGTDEQQIKGYEIKKSQGLEKLGRDIYREYKQFQAGTRGLPTDSYLREIDDINPAVFTQLGGMARDYYYKANSAEADPDKGFILRPKPSKKSKAPVTYHITERGAQIFEEMYRVYSGLFAAKEVKPQPHATKGGIIAGEGGQITRRMTTWMAKYIGDTTMANEAMANQNSVRMKNDYTRTALSSLLFMLGLGNGGSVQSNIDPISQRRDEYYQEGVNGKNYFADIFKIGGQKFKDLQNEKKALLQKVEKLKTEKDKRGNVIASPEQIAIAQRLADNFKPATILRLEREKSINIQEAMLRWDDKGMHHLTYALQLLTGRMHAQQTLYNPQAHPQIRQVVTGNRQYIWKPGNNSNLEKIWKEGMAAHLFEDPKVTDSPRESWKKEKGFRMPTEERLKVFREEEVAAQEKPGEGLWNQYVSWGKELQQLIHPFAKRQAGEFLTQLKNSRDPSQVIKAIKQTYNNNPLSPQLKAYLAKFEHDAVKQADYLIALAKYDEAKKNNKPFTDTQSWEIDGKTHGPLTMGAQFGSTTMTKRGDMVMSVPLVQKIASDEYKDLRDAMADTMVNEFARLADSVAFRGRIGDSKTAALQSILQNAIEDRENFLKKSPMTMGYGQDLMQLRGHVEKAVTLSDEINSLIQNNGLKTDTVINFLHNMMVDSIVQNMDTHAIETMSTIKSIGWQAVMLNEPITIMQPTGLNSYAAGMQYKQADQFSWTAPRTDETKDLVPGRVTETIYKGEAQAQALRYRPGSPPEIGGWTVSRILASLIQAYDADMATGIFTNTKFTGRDKKGDSQFKTTNHWDYIQLSALDNGASKEIVDEQGTRKKIGDPFVVQIYDAFLVDSGSLEAVRKVANKIHKTGLVNENAAAKVFGWYHNEREARLKELRNDTTIYPILKDGKYDEDSPFMKIGELFSGEKNHASAGETASYKNLTKFLKKNSQEKWNNEGTLVTRELWDAKQNKKVKETRRVGKQTLKDWDKRKFDTARAQGGWIVDQLSSMPMSRLDISNVSLITGKSEAEVIAMHKEREDILGILHETGSLSGRQIAKIIDTINEELELDKRVLEAEQNVKKGKKEVAKLLSAGPSNNIDH